jgi:integrase
VTGGVQPSTRKRYRTVLDKFLAWAGADGLGLWNEVTADALTRYAAHLASGDNVSTRKYADKTIHNELIVLKSAINFLLRAGHLRDKAPVVLRLRKPQSQSAYCYKPEEVAAILQHCQDHGELNWLGDVLVALTCTGLRISELVGLRWSDVKFDTGRLELTDESARGGGVGTPRRRLKSGRSRSFPIHSSLRTVLERLRQSSSQPIVFYGPRRGRLKADTVRRVLVRDVLEPLAEKFPGRDGEQSFRDGRLHSFRHYFCSTCVNNHVTEQMIMAWLGHADSGMVRHYYHVLDDAAQRKMEAIDFLGQSPDGPAASKMSP